jgi:biopolymer transport protein ExbD
MSMNLRPRKRHVPVIPIVSLIDIMVILLIFFVATTTFRRQKAHLKIALPESKGLGGVSADSGSRLAIAITKDQKIQLDGQPVEVDALAAALTKLKAEKPAAKLELEADTDTALGILIKVWDALKTAGYSINDVPARIQKAAAAAQP